ncbi:tyrosinase family protein [Arthrobacter sp. ISL-28]|uniref:tyrosinase family protein n=1 Tax=Arthrobacter sp. ISL-28 TaxID=2819108 RepID=UPI0037BEC945
MLAGGGEHVHLSFRDPFAFLLHSNVDRLFARWQTEPGKGWRLDPAQVYGSETNSTAINANLQPWAGTPPPITRPWAHPENEQRAKNSRDATVVTPHLYEGNRCGVPPGFSRVG